MTFEEQKTLEDSYVMHTFGRMPVQLVSGKGMKVCDSAGHEYLDFIGGIGALSLGHCHPALVLALQNQAARLMHVSNYYYIEDRGEVARRLSELLNLLVDEDKKVPWQTFFANSGAEANECAIKLARAHARIQADKAGLSDPPRTIVTLKGGFHGRTLAALAATAQPAKQELFQPLPDGFIAVPLNDSAALEATFKAEGDTICAVLLEPIQGESGVHPCTQEYLQTARRLTRVHNALLMVDEVQCGLFRCGKYPYAFQHFNVLPDVVTMAKGIGGGMPVGACAAQKPVAAAFAPGDHGSTFGGSNLAIAAVRAVLETIEHDGLAMNVEEVGSYLREQLSLLEGVSEVRGLGLMVAAELKDSLDANALVKAALDEGVLLNATGPHTIRFLPPLICTKADVDILIERLGPLLTSY